MLFAGWRTGFIRRALGIVLIVVSIVLGAYLRYPIGTISRMFFKNIPADYANLVGYAIAFPLILGGLTIVSSALFRKPTSGLKREVDGGLGAALGAIEAILIISAVIGSSTPTSGRARTSTTRSGSRAHVPRVVLQRLDHGAPAARHDRADRPGTAQPAAARPTCARSCPTGCRGCR